MIEISKLFSLQSINKRVSSENSIKISFLRSFVIEATDFPLSKLVACSVSSCNVILRKNQSAFRLGNVSAEFLRRFNPFLNDDFDVCQCFLISFAVSHAAREFGNFSDKRFVFFAPINDNFVFYQLFFPAIGIFDEFFQFAVAAFDEQRVEFRVFGFLIFGNHRFVSPQHTFQAG